MKPAVLILAPGVAALTLVTACGGSGPGSGSPAPTVDVSACVAKAEQVVNAAKAPATLTVGTPFQIQPLAGKTIWFVAQSMANANDAQTWSGIQAAAKASGINAKLFDGQGTTTAQNQGVAEAVAQHAAGIDMFGIPPSTVSGPLLQAQQAGIPVISGPQYPPAPGVTGYTTSNYSGAGTEMAAYGAAINGCKVDAVAFYSNLYLNLSQMVNSATAEFQQLCPNTCKLTADDINVGTIATQAGPATSSALRRDPSVNFLIATFDPVAIFMVPAVQQAKSNAKLVGQGGNPANLTYIRSGQVQVADWAFPSQTILGWASFDQLVRSMLKLPASTEDENVALQLLDKSNLDTAGTFPAFANLAAVYEHSWGLS